TVDPLLRQQTPLIDSTGVAVGELPQPPNSAVYQRLSEMLAVDELTVRFLTPTRIVDDNHLSHRPRFRAWFQRLLERVRVISELYCDPVWIPFRDLLAIADSIGILEDGTRWQENWSH